MNSTRITVFSPSSNTSLEASSAILLSLFSMLFLRFFSLFIVSFITLFLTTSSTSSAVDRTPITGLPRCCTTLITSVPKNA